MTKSRHARESKRRARKQADNRLAELGEHWAGAGGRPDQRLIARAIHSRWLTDLSGEECRAIQGGHEQATSKEIAARCIRSGLLSGDSKLEMLAVRNLIAMEAQNQKDEHHAEPQEHEHKHKHIHIHDGSESRLDAILERLRLRESVEQAEQGGPAEDDSVTETSDGHAGRDEGETETRGSDKGTTE